MVASCFRNLIFVIHGLKWCQTERKKIVAYQILMKTGVIYSFFILNSTTKGNYTSRASINLKIEHYTYTNIELCIMYRRSNSYADANYVFVHQKNQFLFHLFFL